MTIILAADSDWAIGRDGGLLAHIPEDMKFFRETTANSTVVIILGDRKSTRLNSSHP